MKSLHPKIYRFRLPMRYRTSRQRYAQKARFMHRPIWQVLTSRRFSKPRAIRIALGRARSMRWWGQLIDPNAAF